MVKQDPQAVDSTEILLKKLDEMERQQPESAKEPTDEPVEEEEKEEAP